MRRLLLLGLLAAALVSCSSKPAAVRLLTTCDGPDGSCAHYRQAVDPADGAPLPYGTLIVPFTSPVRLAQPTDALNVVTATINLEMRAFEWKPAPVRSVRTDPHNPRQMLLEVDGLLADGATLDLPDGTVLDGRGKSIGAVTVPVKTGFDPFAVALAGVIWEPADRTLFSEEGLKKPRGQKAEGPVRQELEARLRIRPGTSDEQVHHVLAQYDGEPLKKKVPDHRLRAGLLLLTSTSAEFAIPFILSDTNRWGVPFEPLRVEPIGNFGAFAAVFFDVARGRLHMIVDTDMAADSLENIAVVLAHETLHSSLAGGSASQETLAMAANTRVYEELLLFDPTIAQSPTAFTRQQNQLTLALRNSGRFGYPRAGILPRPGVDDALRGVEDTPARSFKDLLFQPDVYGDLRRAGGMGTEVLEAYYRGMSGADLGRLAFDDNTLKRFDEVMDNGFTDEQILAIADALKLKPVPLNRPRP